MAKKKTSKKKISKKIVSKKIVSKKIVSKKKTSKKKEPFKIAFSYSVYEKKKTKGKKYSNVRTNKDKSLTRSGLSRKGHKFIEKTYTFSNTTKDVKKFKKIFEKAKRLHKKGKNSVTIKTQYYTGKFNKKTKKITGRKSKMIIENISTKRKIKIGKKTYINLTDFDELIELLDDILQEGTSP